jgi:ATP-dependent DNA helicase RecG
VIYLREGDLTRAATPEEIRDIILRRGIEPERWERRFSMADLETDLAPEEIRAAVDYADRVKRAFFRNPANLVMVLEDFSAAKYGRLTNGGDVLFTRNPAARLPQTRIRAMSYNTDKAGEKFSDLKSFEGPLHAIFEEAYSFIVRNTPTVARFIKGNPKRQDAPLYPEDAVREALINALAHRDYTAPSGGVAIHVFPRRLEIWNSGPFPAGVTEETMRKGQISVLRNPDIAHALYLRGLMEKAGRGSVLMREECEKNGIPVPQWGSDPSLGVTVTFHAPEVTPEVTPEVVRMLSVIDGEMARGEIMAALSLKDEKHFREHYQQSAVGAGLVEMTIPEKPRSSKQRYRLTEQGRQVLSAHREREKS